MTGKVNLARSALILASIWNQNKPLVVEIDNLAVRRVACVKYDGLWGVQAFRVFRELRDWHRSGNVVEVDRFFRPFALGIHLNRPFETAIAPVGYYGCVWVPTDSTPVDTDTVTVFELLGGPHARSEYVGEYIENTWTQAYALEKQLLRLPGRFEKDPEEAGFWEHYSPQTWSELIEGRIRSASVGFRVVRRGGVIINGTSTAATEEELAIQEAAELSEEYAQSGPGYFSESLMDSMAGLLGNPLGSSMSNMLGDLVGLADGGDQPTGAILNL